MDSIFEKIVEDIKNDTTPQTDSRNDIVWKWNNTVQNGYTISITSLSGLMNINFINPELISSSDKLLQAGDIISAMNQARHEGKFLFSYDEVQDVISKENFDKYYTFYGFANINTSDAESLKILSDILTDGMFGTELYNKIKLQKFYRQYIQNETDLQMVFGVYYNSLIPFINIQPQININFIDEDVLKAFLSYPSFNQRNISQKVNTILELRKNGEINEMDICNILGITKSSELYYYLGCRTWFWQIVIAGDDISCRYIIARDPSEDAFGKNTFYLIEKMWL